MTNEDNTLWNSDWNDTSALLKAATATPDNFRIQDPDNPLISRVPDFEDMMPLVLGARDILKSRGVSWRPQSKAERVERPVETPEQHLDSILDRAAAKMIAPKGRRR